MRKKFGLRYWIGQLHLWLGLASGLVVFVVAITGCIYVFQEEIKDALYDYRKIAIENKPFIQPSALKEIALQVYPDAKVSRIVLFDKGRPAWVLLGQQKEYFYVYINPYTGKVLHHENIKDDFFMVIQYLHMYLLLPKEIGKPIVGYSILIFVVMLVSGLILWLPRRKAHIMQRLTVKWKSRWRRVNYDLHNVGGFYIFLVALILAITGLSMSFEWVKKSLHATANLGKSYPREEAKPPLSDTTVIATTSAEEPLNTSYRLASTASPHAAMFLVYFPAKKEGAIHVAAYTDQLHYYKRDNYYYDQYSASLLKATPHHTKSAGLKLNEMNYDVHTGIILGTAGKIIAFLVSFIIASMPITGFMIWWGRRNKKRLKRDE